jgi:hypothetical protein
MCGRNRVVFLTAVTITGTIAPLVFLKDLSTWLFVNHKHQAILWTATNQKSALYLACLGCESLPL